MSNLVLWGHSIKEYQDMFDLSPQQLSGRLLDYGSGPSAFNVDMCKAGLSVVSCDPLFSLDKATLSSKTKLVFEDMLEKVRQTTNTFDFSQYGTFEQFIAKRRFGMSEFLADYLLGKQQKRYLGIQDIRLPFTDFFFDLALSSHYLFSDMDNQDLSFHLNVIKELARVAKEVRIFPLIDCYGQPSSFLGPVLLNLQQNNYGVEVKSVNYSLQPQGNAMLRIWAQECRIND